jgi:predicted enzyme related to lactoylglutathione lyase
MNKKISLLFIYLAAVFINTSGCASKQTASLPPLTLTPTGHHQISKFVWFDLLTEDSKAAQDFYMQLFGWRFAADNNTPDYIVIYSGDKPIGGIVPHEDKDPNIPESMWLVSLSVGDVDQAVSVAKALNGEVLDGPTDVKGRGRMAVIRDAEAAELVLIRAEGGDPPDAGIKSGEWLWVDLFTKDAEKALDFYGAVAGYSPQSVPTKDEDFIILLRRNSRAYGGVVKLHLDGVEPNWLPYIKVDDLMGTISRAQKLGGTILLRTENVAIIADPSGGVFGIQMVGGAKS